MRVVLIAVALVPLVRHSTLWIPSTEAMLNHRLM